MTQIGRVFIVNHMIVDRFSLTCCDAPPDGTAALGQLEGYQFLFSRKQVRCHL